MSQNQGGRRHKLAHIPVSTKHCNNENRTKTITMTLLHSKMTDEEWDDVYFDSHENAKGRVQEDGSKAGEAAIDVVLPRHNPQEGAEQLPVQHSPEAMRKESKNMHMYRHRNSLMKTRAGSWCRSKKTHQLKNLRTPIGSIRSQSPAAVLSDDEMAQIHSHF